MNKLLESEEVKFLLDRIDKLKKKGVRGKTIAMSFIMHAVQPIKRQDKLGWTWVRGDNTKEVPDPVYASGVVARSKVINQAYTILQHRPKVSTDQLLTIIFTQCQTSLLVIVVVCRTSLTFLLSVVSGHLYFSSPLPENDTWGEDYGAVAAELLPAPRPFIPEEVEEDSEPDEAADLKKKKHRSKKTSEPETAAQPRRGRSKKKSKDLDLVDW